MAIKTTARSRAKLLKRTGVKPRRDAWDATNSTADGLMLEMVDFEHLTISFIEAGLMTPALAAVFRERARRSHREVVLCLRELAATDVRAFGPVDARRFRESLGTWRAMKRIGLRTRRRLDALFADA